MPMDQVIFQKMLVRTIDLLFFCKGYFFNRKPGTRVDPATQKSTANSFLFPAMAPNDIETHGGDDVGIFAIGPNAHLFTGVMEQYMIPHKMAYISCVGSGATLCN